MTNRAEAFCPQSPRSSIYSDTASVTENKTDPIAANTSNIFSTVMAEKSDPTEQSNVLQRTKDLNTIKNEYILNPESEYVKEAISKESEGLLDEARQIDEEKAKTILEGSEGSVWWIREGISKDGQKTLKGIFYSDGTITRSVLHTNDLLLRFFELHSPNLHLNTVLKEKAINRAKSEYVLDSDSEYIKRVLSKESEELLDEARDIDKKQAKFVLGGPEGTIWWIREGISKNGQKVHKGIIYSDGTVSRSLLYTDDLLMKFVDLHRFKPHMSEVYKERYAKIIDEYIIPYISTRYHSRPYLDRQRLINTALYDAQEVLGDSEGTIWWLSKEREDDLVIDTGIVYRNGNLERYPLRSASQCLKFFNRHCSIPHLEVSRKEKIDMIEKEFITPYLSKYSTRDSREGPEELIDTIEAQSFLQGFQGNTWWIRKPSSSGSTYTGIFYSNGNITYTPLFRDQTLLNFFHKHRSVPHLETVQKNLEKQREEKKQYCVLLRDSSLYVLKAFHEESQGLLNQSFLSDISEVQSVLGDKQGSVWWIREGIFNGQKVYKVIQYTSGEGLSYTNLYTNNDLTHFLDQKPLNTHLETIRKDNYFEPLKDLTKQLYDVLEAAYDNTENRNERCSEVQKIVRSWLVLVHPDKTTSKEDDAIRKSFQDKASIEINDETLRAIKEGEVIRSLHAFKA